jgi:hypothetical protein
VLFTSIFRAITALMIEAVRTTETSVNVHQTTWCKNPEDNHFFTHHCENLKISPCFMIAQAVTFLNINVGRRCFLFVWCNTMHVAIAVLRKQPVNPTVPMKPLYWTRIIVPPSKQQLSLANGYVQFGSAI